MKKRQLPPGLPPMRISEPAYRLHKPQDRHFGRIYDTNRFTRLSDIKTEPAKDICSPFIKEGEVVAIVGPEGKGKSKLVAMIAALISSESNYQRFRDGKTITAEMHGCVAFFQRENELHKLRSEIFAYGGDLDKCLVFEQSESKWEAAPINIEELVCSNPDLKLLVFDSIRDLLMLFEHQKRGRTYAFDEITKIARKYKLAVIVICHFSRGNERTLNPLDRIHGGQELGIITRHVWFVTEIQSAPPNLTTPIDSEGNHLDTQERFVVMEVKESNIHTSERTALAYIFEKKRLEEPSLKGEVGIVCFLGYASPSERQAALNQVQRTPQSTDSAAQQFSTKKTHAKEWLLERLKHGPLPATKLNDDAAAEGISQMTLRRAREDLKILQTRQRLDNQARAISMWSLPEKPLASDNQSPPQDEPAQ